MLSGQTIFITGGTGTLGQAFIKKVLSDFPMVKEVIIYSRDEMKQYDLKRQYPETQFPQLKWVIGDVRDLERLRGKMKGADLVIHAAAMKHIPICEENPEECLKTNVDGTKNVILAASEYGVKKTILCSTDKAVSPISIYGNSKQAAEKLFLHAGDEHSKFAIVRLGNIWGSRGSVVPLFKSLHKTGVIPITHPSMTRFFCTEAQSAQSLLYGVAHMKGGEIFIPKMTARKITDVADELAPGCIHKTIGLRGFEKMEEDLISDLESKHVWETTDYWIIHESDTSSEYNRVGVSEIQIQKTIKKQMTADTGFSLN